MLSVFYCLINIFKFLFNNSQSVLEGFIWVFEVSPICAQEFFFLSSNLSNFPISNIIPMLRWEHLVNGFYGSLNFRQFVLRKTSFLRKTKDFFLPTFQVPRFLTFPCFDRSIWWSWQLYGRGVTRTFPPGSFHPCVPPRQVRPLGLFPSEGSSPRAFPP